MEAASHQRTSQNTPADDATRRVTPSRLERNAPMICRCCATKVKARTLAELSGGGAAEVVGKPITTSDLC